MNTSVSIATKPLVYSAFRYINNKVHNALAEYVDNSIQSYLDNQDLLSEINSGHKLTVRIKIDPERDIITIKDNAFGISEKYYDKAFELANIPLDASGLNEFGMGMKVSSIWLSNLWTVETSAYGEEYKKTLVFDLNDVVDKEKLSLDVKNEQAKKDEHYTLITLKQLSQNKPSLRQLTGIKKHLASIYSKYIRDGLLDLFVNDELQEITDLKVLDAPYFDNPDGPSILWRKPIKFDAGPYHVKGFIGLLETMSTSTDNGFLLFRRGRVIGSSYEDRYRPVCLCGESGSPRFKRVFGELELEGFHVSFTKNSFTEGDDFEMFIKLLAEDLKKDKSFKIFEQGQNYKKPSNPATPKVARSLTDTLTQTFSRPVVRSSQAPITTRSVNPVSKEGAEAEQQETKENISVVHPSTEPKPAEPIANPQVTKINIDGYDFMLELGHVKGEDSGWLYDLSKIGTDTFKTQFNLTHKYFERFGADFKTEDGYLPVATFIKAMVSAELALQNGGDESGGVFRTMFNKLIGQI